MTAKHALHFLIAAFALLMAASCAVPAQAQSHPVTPVLGPDGVGSPAPNPGGGGGGTIEPGQCKECETQ